jgi:iron complex outermembrane receptor protein
MAGPNRKFSRTGRSEVAAAVSAILAMAAAQNAGAQASEPESEAGLTEVIVTATRRAESLQDVPESITAFDTNAIAMRGMQQMEDYVRFVPGLSMSDRQPAGTTIVFRGVASSGLQFGAVSSSGLYLDEQPITQSGRNPDPRLIDIERIEALRGPQGTLYGASSQSGTLRVITNKPDPKGFDGWAEAQLNSVDHGDTGHDISAMVNLALVPDKLALRLVGFSSEDAGYIDNIVGDSQGGTFTSIEEDDVNSVKTRGGRAALRLDISEAVNSTLSVTFQDVKANGHGDMNLDVGDLNQVRFEDESLDDKWYQLGLTVNAALPAGDAVFSASYFNRDFRYEADATDYEFAFNQNATYDSPAYDFGGDPRGFATNHEETEITTFEARLASKADSTSRWGWLVGTFYSMERGETAFDSNVRGYGDTPSFAYFNDYEVSLTNNTLTPTDTWFSGRYDTELDQIAVFGEVNFDVTENFTITAGGRWFDYDRKVAQTQEQPPGFTGATRLDGNQESSEDGTVAKLNFTYELDADKMVYATYSEGFRVGGSNPLKPASLLPRNFSSDTLKNYEVGAKTEWMNRRVRLNVSAYYMEWEDFAVQIEDPQPEVFQLAFVNLPTAEIPGIEADLAVEINSQWQLDASLGWNDAKTKEATTLTVTDDLGEEFSFAVSKGARLPLTPDWNASVGVEFHANTNWFNAEPFFRFDYSYVGSSLNSLEGIESVVSGNPVDRQAHYEIADVRFGLEGERWSGQVFVDNLWDERANQFLNNRWKVQRQSVNRPRTIGIQFRYNF